jgi:hypothetical protein
MGLSPACFATSRKRIAPYSPLVSVRASVIVPWAANGLTEGFKGRVPPHGRIRGMGVEMHEVGRHSLRPPVANCPFAEPLMEAIESQGEPLAPVASPLFLGWAFIKQRCLVRQSR